MRKVVTTVGLDADDTLWHNETIFRLTQDRFKALMADHADPEVLEARLAEIEKRNLRLYGYGGEGLHPLLPGDGDGEPTTSRGRISPTTPRMTRPRPWRRAPCILLPAAK
ncbi:hypothetical protein [Phenylobacterium sp. J367]|uniref:hypothetical protein n=1 Tax=Phenylobacterium sp. J367 TaxID=2898435 RepID=UPI0021509AF3|nr:hypothetical protein [Phenylobacterium sp. J367]MCR5877045.1 hypothetical protein [Phenylobacterium sp. J367]